LNDSAPKEQIPGRFNEGYTLRDMGSMANHYDGGVPWETLAPRMDPLNGEEPVGGGMWTESLDDPSQWYIGPIIRK